MKIKVNGDWVETAAATVAEVLEQLGFGPRVATALNGDFLPVTRRAAAMLAEGDALEVVAPMQGG